MRLTVGIPAWNAARTLARVLEAARPQIAGGDRIVVVDDGSTDGTARVAEAAGIDCVRHPENLGLAVARNTLLSHAATDLILYLDADAVPAAGTVQMLREAFVTPDVAAVGGRGIETDLRTRAARWRATHCAQDHGDAVIESDWMVMGLCACFRTDALREIGGFDARFRACAEDVDASLRLRARGYRLRYLPDAVVHHVRADGVRGVTRQAYRHTVFAARAIAASGDAARLAAYRRESLTHVARVTAHSLSRLEVFDAAIGAANLVARAAALVRASWGN
jgi:GT2 family glycosyltransferase